MPKKEKNEKMLKTGHQDKKIKEKKNEKPEISCSRKLNTRKSKREVREG